MKKFVIAAATVFTLAASLGAASAQSMNYPGQLANDRPGEFFSDAYRSGMKIGG